MQSVSQFISKFFFCYTLKFGESLLRLNENVGKLKVPLTLECTEIKCKCQSLTVQKYLLWCTYNCYWMRIDCDNTIITSFPGNLDDFIFHDQQQVQYITVWQRDVTSRKHGVDPSPSFGIIKNTRLITAFFEQVAAGLWETVF